MVHAEVWGSLKKCTLPSQTKFWNDRGMWGRVRQAGAPNISWSVCEEWASEPRTHRDRPATQPDLPPNPPAGGAAEPALSGGRWALEVQGLGSAWAPPQTRGPLCSPLRRKLQNWGKSHASPQWLTPELKISIYDGSFIYSVIIYLFPLILWFLYEMK